jgi:UDP-N-acetyl-D-mannosaminuronic acid dehydrogenase
VIRWYGGEPISQDKAFTDVDGVLLITDHPDYRAIQVDALLHDDRPLFVYDSWRILDEAAVTAAGIRYAGLGYLPTAAARRVGGRP